MKKSIFALLVLCLTLNVFAQKDNLTLKSSSSISSVDSSFVSLGGGASNLTKSYVDEDKTRTDKVFYVGTHSYRSNFRLSEVNDLLNPALGKLETLLDDATVRKAGASYAVKMNISTPIKNFECLSTMNYKKVQSGAKTIHTYAFTKFNMVFTDFVIEVTTEDLNGQTKISMRNIAAIKGSTIAKLKKVFAVGRFESALKDNMKAFKKGVGGI